MRPYFFSDSIYACQMTITRVSCDHACTLVCVYYIHAGYIYPLWLYISTLDIIYPCDINISTLVIYINDKLLYVLDIIIISTLDLIYPHWIYIYTGFNISTLDLIYPHWI